MKDFGSEFRLTLITNDPFLAAKADRGGVDRIGIDLEYIGKAERQAGHNTRLSNHSIGDLSIGKALVHAKLFVRLNPLNANTHDEVETVLHCGAQILMLPFFRTAREVEAFVRLVDERAQIVILLETASALVRIRDILSVSGLCEVMIGLNDLRFELAVDNHFELLASPLLDFIASEVRRAGLVFSVGGVARPEDSSLPIAPDLVLAQFPRLGATGAFLSRSFFRGIALDGDVDRSILSLRRRLTEWAAESPESWERARKKLAEHAYTTTMSERRL